MRVNYRTLVANGVKVFYREADSRIASVKKPGHNS
jgi:hypothetical protein